MQKIKFGDLNLKGELVYEPVALSDDYQMLALFISDTIDMVDEVIDQFETILKGEKTYEETMEGYAIWSFGAPSGVFECDATTAYFISEDERLPSMEMPLQELLDLMYEWKAFLGK